MQEEIEKSEEIAVIEKAPQVFAKAPEVLLANQTRKQKVLEAGNKHLANWQKVNVLPEGPEKDAHLAQVDAMTATYIEKAKEALATSKGNREPITQIMTAMAKYFTECENDINVKKEGTVVYALQKERDKYVSYKIKQKEEQERAIEKEKQKKIERINIVSATEVQISTKLNSILAEQKLKMQNFFNNITLESYESAAMTVRNKVVAPPVGEDLKKEIGKIVINTVCVHHSEPDIVAIIEETLNAYNLTNFCNKYQEEILELKNSLVDQLQSKKNELDEEKALKDKAEQDRLAEEERMRLAEEQRQKEMAEAKSKKEKELLEKQQQEQRDKEIAYAKERERLAKEEQEKAQKEREEREQAENKRILEEQQKAQDEAELKIKTDAEGKKTIELFDELAEKAEIVTPDSKSSYKIVIKNNGAYLQLALFWFEEGGKKLENDKIEKKSFGQIITWAEAYAKKTSKKVESPMLEYTIVHVAKQAVMQNGSHSRNSYPLDKMVPKTIIRGTNKDRVPPGATIKKMHKKKQRQYNSKLCQL